MAADPVGRRHKAIAVGVTALLLAQALVPVQVGHADDQYDLLVSQLSGLVEERSQVLQDLIQVDGLVGSLLARDALAAARPPTLQQVRLLHAAVEAARRANPTEALAQAPAFFRATEPGILLGAHQPVLDPSRSQSADPLAGLRQGLIADGGALARPQDSAASISLSAGAAPMPAEAAPALPPRYQSLGDAQSLAPSRAIELEGQSLPLASVAPQAVAPPSLGAPVIAPTWYAASSLHGLPALRVQSQVTDALASTLASFEAPSSLPSDGLHTGLPLTSSSNLDALLGHYVLSVGRVARHAPDVLPASLAPQVTWSITATMPLSAGTTLTAEDQAVAAGGKVRQVAYSTFTIPIAYVPPARQGAHVQVDFTAGGGSQVSVETVLPDTTAISATAAIDGLQADSALTAALRKEQALRAEMDSIMAGGNDVYSRLNPLYQSRARQYQQALAVVMHHNALLEQAWWDNTQRWTAYQAALTRWKARRTAYLHYLKLTGHRQAPALGRQTRRRATTASAGSPSIPLASATAVHRRLGMSLPMLAQMRARRHPAGAAQSPQQSPLAQVTPASVLTPIFGPTSTPGTGVTATETPAASVTPAGSATVQLVVVQPASSTPSDTPSATVEPTAVPSDTATATAQPPTTTPTDTASSTASPAIAPSDTATASPRATASSTATAPEASATATPTDRATATDTATPLAQPSVTGTETPASTDTAATTSTPSPPASPTGTASSTASATPSPAPSASPSTTPSPTATIVRVPPPGSPPASVPPPGPEPNYEPLPPPLPSLPGWIDDPVTISPVALQSMLAHGLGANGYASLTAAQLIAGGALDNVAGYQPPLRGVITTYWGGSTPWQSFHTGVDIAAPIDTPVHAAADGIVVYAGLAAPGEPTVSYGNCVVIMHNAHLSTLYGHMDLGLHGLLVRPGEVVRQGQVIGFEGQTGWATGPHVHFEMRLDNVQFDPLLLVDARAITG